MAPVNKALFGGWEGNWMAYNTASDVVLPKSSGEKVHFFMYPVAENAAGALTLMRRMISSTRSRPKKSWLEVGLQNPGSGQQQAEPAFKLP